MKICAFVSLEGNDGAGKTTHAKRLQKHLEDSGFRAVYVKSPDRESVCFERIYSMLESGWASANPVSFQLVQFANKLHFQHFRLPKLMEEMDVIIMDRWDLSMQAYGLATGVPPRVIRIMSRMLVKPDHVFLFSGNKSLRSSPRDTYEKDDSLQKAVSEFYNSKDWRTRYNRVVDIIVEDNPDDTFRSILDNFQF
jgi:dTMP kinase